ADFRCFGSALRTPVTRFVVPTMSSIGAEVRNSTVSRPHASAMRNSRTAPAGSCATAATRTSIVAARTTARLFITSPFGPSVPAAGRDGCQDAVRRRSGALRAGAALGEDRAVTRAWPIVVLLLLSLLLAGVLTMQAQVSMRYHRVTA